MVKMREMTPIEIERGKSASRFYLRLSHFFIVDAEFGGGEADKLYSEVVGWCWDQYGAPETKKWGNWECYSMVVAFSEANHALEFKMRWC